MTDTHLPGSVERADRAEWLLATLRRREPAEADLQACAMVMAGLKMLQEMRGTPAILDTLSRIGPALVAERPEPLPAAEAAPTAAPATYAEHLYGIVAARPPEEGRAQADAMLSAATALLIAQDGCEGAIAALGRLAESVRAVQPAPAPVPVPTLPPEHLAHAIVDHLRTLPRHDAHERARAAVAGSAAYLHEAFGRTYATAVLGGTLENAAAYGDEMRGGRDSLDTLH